MILLAVSGLEALGIIILCAIFGRVIIAVVGFLFTGSIYGIGKIIEFLYENKRTVAIGFILLGLLLIFMYSESEKEDEEMSREEYRKLLDE